MEKKTLQILCLVILISFSFGKTIGQNSKMPVIVITDLYHPGQDPGDNLDLINGFGLPDVDLKAVLLDITEAFRKDTAYNSPTKYNDPLGPREAGIIPIEQLNYIFNKKIPYGMGPLTCMKSEDDKMEYLPKYEQEAIYLFLDILAKSKEPIEILSFGSARILAVAYNRNPKLMNEKISKIHLCAGRAAKDYELKNATTSNPLPEIEWNVALDLFAFTRILKSDLPVAIYPCWSVKPESGSDKGINDCFWKFDNMNFTKDMHPQLRRYLDYAFTRKLQYDFLRAMNADYPTKIDVSRYPSPFPMWESAVWLLATQREMVCNPEGEYRVVKKSDIKKGDRVISNELKSCNLDEIRDDGYFIFSYTDKPVNKKEIYYRSDVTENEIALQNAIPKLFISITPN